MGTGQSSSAECARGSPYHQPQAPAQSIEDVQSSQPPRPAPTLGHLRCSLRDLETLHAADSSLEVCSLPTGDQSLASAECPRARPWLTCNYSCANIAAHWSQS